MCICLVVHLEAPKRGRSVFLSKIRVNFAVINISQLPDQIKNSPGGEVPDKFSELFFHIL